MHKLYFTINIFCLLRIRSFTGCKPVVTPVFRVFYWILQLLDFLCKSTTRETETMREIETDSNVFVRKLDSIMYAIEDNPGTHTFHTLFQHSNNKLKIEIGCKKNDERQLIYVFYDADQRFFKSMEKDMDIHEMRLLMEVVKMSFSEAHLVRNAHIQFSEELYYFVQSENESEC